MNPLEQLKDVHIPPEVSNWPPAYGWWIVALIFLLAVAAIIIWQFKRFQSGKVKRQALRELCQINSDSPDWPLQLNSLLKRVSLSYFPQIHIANLYDESWSEFLTEQLPVKKRAAFKQHFQLLQSSLYRESKTTIADFEQSRTYIQQWIQYSLPPNKQQLTNYGGKNV